MSISSISFTQKLILVFVTLNTTIIVLLYKYTETDTPVILIGQLMIPLIIWQIILSISFFPDEFIEQFLDDFYGRDGAAGDQAFHHPLDLTNPIRSSGDAPQPVLLGEDHEPSPLNFLF